MKTPIYPEKYYSRKQSQKENEKASMHECATDTFVIISGFLVMSLIIILAVL